MRLLRTFLLCGHEKERSAFSELSARTLQAYAAYIRGYLYRRVPARPLLQGSPYKGLRSNIL